MILTYSFRLKDQGVKKKLGSLARAVDLVWNYTNETSYNAIRNHGKWLSKYDFRPLLKGVSKLLPINSQTVQAVSDELVTRRKQFKKVKLKWRGRKSLGWIPFNGQTVQIRGAAVYYNGEKFRYWNHREISGKIKTGSFTQDARGRWYVHFQCEVVEKRTHGEREIGIDFGLKEKITCSDGEKHTRENLTVKYEKELAQAQRAGKSRRIKALHAKIANKRKDWAHKVSTFLCESSKTIVIGKIDSKKLAKTRLAKSVLDASWSSFSTLLQYKAIRHGMVVKTVSEKWSTQTCSSCGVIPEGAPKGISALGVRRWRCSKCGTDHDRDVNAARNIFNFGAGRCTPTGSLSLE